MPDNVENRLMIFGSENEVKKVLESINGYTNSDEMHIDFNKIIPMPDEIKNTSSISISDAISIMIFDYGIEISESELQSKQNYIKEVPVSMIKKERQNIKLMYSNKIKYGHPTWYEWAYANWKTKWNAYDQQLSNKTINFNTVWTNVLYLILKLSEMFPKVSLNYAFNEAADYEHYHIYEIKGGDIKYYKDHNWVCLI